MPKLSRCFLLTVIILLVTVNCYAGQIRAYVAPFAVTGAVNKDEIKTTLQNLLMSRLSNDSVIAVESADLGEIQITGSYIAFGKIFSIDAVAKSREGKVLVRAFEQGESQEEMLQSIGKLAKTLLAGIARSSNLTPQVVVPATVREQPQGIVRTEKVVKQVGANWISQKLNGELVGIALGRKLPDSEREVFVAGSNSLQYYRLGKELSLVAEVTLPVYQKILGIDVADLDADGNPEIYLTVMNGEDLASEVWAPGKNSLQKIGEKLPYYFRAIAFQGKSGKVYAQQKGRDEDYYGDLYELTKNATTFSTNSPLKLPRYANIFNTGMIRTKEGKSYFVVLSPDGYIVIFDENRKDLWKSSDKYGGSVNYFSREDLQGIRTTGALQRKTFLEQRIIVTKSGEIMIPKNEGFFNVGDSRSFSKNSIFAFTWNGVMLDEIWHTKLSQNYLADYLYDEDSRELLLLEVVKKAGIFDKGASAITIKKVE